MFFWGFIPDHFYDHELHHGSVTVFVITGYLLKHSFFIFLRKWNLLSHVVRIQYSFGEITDIRNCYGKNIICLRLKEPINSKM